MTAQHPDQLDLEGLESARVVVEKFLDQHAMMRGTDKEDIYGLHVGTDREAVLKASHLRSILLGLRASEAECERQAEAHEAFVVRTAGLMQNAADNYEATEALATSQAEIIKGLMDELIAGVNLQLEHYGDATKLHMAMIGWAKSARAAIALARTPAGSDEARPDAGAVGGEGR